MNNSNITIPKISDIIKFSTATISRYLKQLQNKKIIERIGSNKSGYWKIKEYRVIAELSFKVKDGEIID